MACCTTDVTVCTARYADVPFSYDFFESDGVTPLDITGWVFQFQVRNSGGTVIYTFANADMTIDAMGGTVYIVLSSTQTEALTEGATYYAGLLVERDTGEIWAHPDRLVLDVFTPPSHS